MKSNPSKQEQTKSEMTTNFRQNIPNLFNSKQMGAHKQSMEFGMYEGSSTKMARASKPDDIDKKGSVLVQARNENTKEIIQNVREQSNFRLYPWIVAIWKVKPKRHKVLAYYNARPTLMIFGGTHAL